MKRNKAFRLNSIVQYNVHLGLQIELKLISNFSYTSRIENVVVQFLANIFTAHLKHEILQKILTQILKMPCLT